MPAKKTSAWLLLPLRVDGQAHQKEGECAAIWNMSGERKKIEARGSAPGFSRPASTSTRRPVAVPGRAVPQRPPRAHARADLLFFDPCVHESVQCKDAYKLDANEALVVYNEKATAAAACPDAITLELSSNGEMPQKGLKVGDADLRRVNRRIVTGPAIFIPSSDEWVHEFSWHGCCLRRQEPARRRATSATRSGRTPSSSRSSVMPDQMYYSVKDVRTKDDAQIRCT